MKLRIAARLSGLGRRPKRQLAALTLIAVTLGLIPSVMVAAKPNDLVPSSKSAHDVIVQYALPEASRVVNPASLPPPATPPFTLYGDGLLVCGQDSATPFTDGVDPTDIKAYDLPTATTLTSTQIQQLLQQISDTGFFNLKKEYYKSPVAGQQDRLRVSLKSGESYVLYYNDVPAPKAYSDTVALLQNYCKPVKKTYSPSQVTLNSLKYADTGTDNLKTPTSPAPPPIQNSDNLDPSVAPIFQNAIADDDALYQKASGQTSSTLPPTESQPGLTTQKLTGQAATNLITAMKNKPQQFVRANGVVYEVSLELPLPDVKNPLNINYTAIRSPQVGLGAKLKNLISPQASADGTTPVRIVLLLPNSGGSTDRLTQAQSLGAAVQNWYCGQVGSCYLYQGVQVLRGSQSASYYTSCQPDYSCADPLANLLNNVQAADVGTIYRGDVDTIIVTGWNTGEGNTGFCGEGLLGSPLGAMDLYEPSDISNPHGYCLPGATMGHELGHTFGLDHTNNGTLMDPSDNSNCDIGNSHLLSCRLDSGQAATLRSTSYFGNPPPSSTLYVGQRFYPGSSLHSASGNYTLTLQLDGNLVIYNAAHQPTWQNHTAGKHTAFLGMQTDGNVVQYNTSHKAIWATGSQLRGGDHLIMQDDGNLVLATPTNRAVWSSSTGLLGPRPRLHIGERMTVPLPGQAITPDQYLLSPSGNYQLILQQDGNLVVYNASHQPIWTNHTDGRGSAYLIMQPDGNLVQYNTAGQSIWNSGTLGKGGTSIALQDDGNLVMFNDAGTPVWSIYTGVIIQPAPAILYANQSLVANQYLLSAGGKYQLIMQPDGNLVFYTAAHNLVWQSNTYGKGGVRVTMQPDGNFVMYNSKNQAVWQSNTYGRGGDHVIVQDDANFVIVSAANQPVWSIQTGLITQPAPSILYSNQSLGPNQYLLSPDGRYEFVLQSDGNMVLYNASHQAVWQSGTLGSGATQLIMQPDGNLVLYNSAHNLAWLSNTYGSGGDHLEMQSDGNLVLYTAAHNWVWQTGTEGR
jgi:hypothetical protein